MEWLEDEASAYQTTEREKKNFEWRIRKINRANIATYKDIVLVEPERESGVFSMFLILSTVEQDSIIHLKICTVSYAGIHQ